MTKNVIYQTLDKNSNKNIYFFYNFIHENIKQDKLIPHPTDKNWFMIADDYVFEFLLTFDNEIQKLSPIVVPVLQNIMPKVFASDIIGLQLQDI